MPTPEELARQNIDRQLEACGWIVQSQAEMNIMAGLGVAVREFKLNSGYADYGLYVDGTVIGVIEAKKEGYPLTGVETQSGKYADGLPTNVPHYSLPIPFYDLRTNMHFTLKTNPLKRADVDEFVKLYKPGQPPAKRRSNWCEEEGKRGKSPKGLWRDYDYDEICKRDKLNLDIFWLKDDSLEDSEDLPDPDILAQEIVDDLQTALEQFANIAAELNG